MTSYWGWIEIGDKDANFEDEIQFLKSLGVVLGTYVTDDQCFDDCRVSPEAMNKLQPHEGRFFWGLEPVEFDPDGAPGGSWIVGGSP